MSKISEIFDVAPDDLLSFGIRNVLSLCVFRDADRIHRFYIMADRVHQDSLEELKDDIDCPSVTFTPMEDYAEDDKIVWEMRFDENDLEDIVKDIFPGNGREKAEIARQIKGFITGEEQPEIVYSKSTYRPPGQAGFI